MVRILVFVIGYFIGCFQTGFIVGKLSNNIDIRKHGSGNAGTTNALRVLGWKVALVTFLGDFLKAVLTVLVVRAISGGDQGIALLSGLGVVMGHNFPFFLGFNGGKGIASTAGALLAFDWKIGLLAMLIMAIIVFTTKYVSLGSLILAVWIPIGIYIFYGLEIELIAIGLILTISAFYRHKENIKRLLQGNENKLGQSKKA